MLKRVIQDGPDTKFRCFSATQEVIYPSLFKARKRNLEMVKEEYKAKGISGLADLLEESLKAAQPKRNPDPEQWVRFHISGDFFKSWYFLAWCEVARRNPLWTVYGYTKAVPFVIKYREEIPPNMVVNLSYGGTHDHLIKDSGFKYAEVVFSEEEAEAKGLVIDHDDRLAADPNHGPFAVLLHGVQPAGSDAAKALVQINKIKRERKKAV